MNEIPVLGVSILNRCDLFIKCADSIDYPINTLVVALDCDYEALNKILNLRSHISEKASRNIGRVEVLFSSVRTGAATAHNAIFKNFSAPWWILANCDVQFLPGSLKKISEEVPKLLNKTIICLGSDSLYCFALTEAGFKRIGMFDENFYPFYFDDCDWYRRMILNDPNSMAIVDSPIIHGEVINGELKVSSTIHSDKKLQEYNDRTFPLNREYYVRKWGGLNGQETFKYPFNNPSWPLNYWEYDPIMKRVRRELVIQ